ncbi:MAG: tRNA (N(6)-L-threonylcarbamoyladenosine(37)-C(2))-methylthiotransferase MtaB [Desulfobacteraceae bacterium]|nr:tRNA (N(6)-L-threonylcarbamoyladenosine(37)-C(2))-methylthiotransferase MtaB [Desulfobacteraceae bacterium]
MNQFYITTLGCKVNQYESDGIATALISNGWLRVDSPGEADISIINTCAVTSRAAMQSRQEIRSIIRSNPEAKVVVTGCHAQTEPELVKGIENVHSVLGHTDKFKIAEAIIAADEGLDDLPSPQKPFSSATLFQGFEPAVTGNKTRAYLKIQDGCNSFCTYCIVPYARGRSRSMPEKDIISHLEHLDRKGYKEAVITGIHTGAWGLDLADKSSFTKLLRTIVEKDPIHRIRISSIEPKELTDEIIGLAAGNPIICDHFHIPLQSGDDEILKRMGRPYDTGYFKELIWKIHEAMPHAAMGIDVLQGFPGESEEAFERTHALLAGLPISYLHVFPFSARKGTPAYDYPDKVDSETLKRRCAAMRALGLEKRRAFEQKNLGRRLEGVIQEERDRSTGMLKAITSNYLTLLVEGGDEFKRCAVDVTLESVVPAGTLHGTIVQP